MFHPVGIKGALHNYKVLSKAYGQFMSMQRWEAIDGDGNPVPWFTYPAIEYLNQLDFSHCRVFEYGSGNSTRFWAGRCKSLVSVEDNPQWYEKIGPLLPDNVDYRLCPAREDYVHCIKEYDQGFDVIVIDGNYRNACAHAITDELCDAGIVILDNSESHEKTAALLRSYDLIQVDMSGFGPLNDYTWITSIFFSRNAQLTPRFERQPVRGIGGAVREEIID